MTQDWISISSPEAMERFAPAGLEVLLRTMGAVSVPESVVALVRGSCGAAIGLPPLSSGTLVGASLEESKELVPAAQGKLAAFVEQFSVDVSAIDAAMREDFVAEFGDRSHAILTMAYVADMAPRVMAVLDRLFVPPANGWPRPIPARQSAQQVTNEFLRVVYSLRELDPVLSEMIRLRGAGAHNCRLCKTVLSRPAMIAGADGTIFDAVDNYRDSSLSGSVKAALALVDAMIWQPAHLPQDVIDDIRADFTPSQAIEIVLDVMRNAVNKVAVALDLDGAHVAQGFEVYEYFEDGHMEFGLSVPVISDPVR